MNGRVPGLSFSQFTSSKKEKSLPPKLKQKPRNWLAYWPNPDLMSVSELRAVATHMQGTGFLFFMVLI